MVTSGSFATTVERGYSRLVMITSLRGHRRAIGIHGVTSVIHLVRRGRVRRAGDRAPIVRCRGCRCGRGRGGSFAGLLGEAAGEVVEGQEWRRFGLAAGVAVAGELGLGGGTAGIEVGPLSRRYSPGRPCHDPDTPPEQQA